MIFENKPIKLLWSRKEVGQKPHEWNVSFDVFPVTIGIHLQQNKQPSLTTTTMTSAVVFAPREIRNT